MCRETKYSIYPQAIRILQLCNNLNLAKHIFGKRLNGNAASGRLCGEIFAVNLVKSGKIIYISKEANRFNRLIKACACSFANCLQIFANLLSLLLNCLCLHIARGGVYCDLAACEKQAVCLNRLAVRADCAGGVIC